jgi:hypothetical protein
MFQTLPARFYEDCIRKVDSKVKIAKHWERGHRCFCIFNALCNRRMVCAGDQGGWRHEGLV